MDSKSEEFKQLEKRAMSDYFRGKTASKNIKEYRDTAVKAGITLGNTAENTAGNGGISVPLSVQNTIIQKLNETSPVFNRYKEVTLLGSSLFNLSIYVKLCPYNRRSLTIFRFKL